MLHTAYSRRVTLALLILPLALLTGCGGQAAKVPAAAERLGLPPDAQIAQVRRCWDIFAHCGEFAYYRTDLTQEELAHNLAGLGWETDYEMEVDGYEIFTNLNFGTQSDLTIDGTDGIESRLSLPIFKGYRWRLTDPQGAHWAITHFPLASHTADIALDGQPLEQNIVSILYQTR